MTTTYYRDAGNRSVSEEDIARKWIAAHPSEAAALLRSGRSAPQPRPFAIHTKAGADGKVTIQPAREGEGNDNE